MLTRLRVDNFKGFASPQSARLGPLTLIFGPNSAGKSALIHALLAMAQSLPPQGYGRYEERSPQLLWAGRSVDLGGFANVVHSHDLDRVISLGLTRLDSREGSEDELSFDMWMSWDPLAARGRIRSFRYRLEGNPQADLWLKEYRLSLSDGESAAGDEEHETMGGPSHEAGGSVDLWVVDEERTSVDYMVGILRDHVRRMFESGHAGPDDDPTRLDSDIALRKAVADRTYGARGFLPLASGPLLDPDGASRREFFIAAHEWAGVMESRARMHWNDLRRMRHIGPLRQAPTRAQVRLESDDRRKAAYVGATGDALIDVLLANEFAVEQANYWMERLGMPYAVSIRTLELDDAPSVGAWVTLILTHLPTGVSVSLADVGVGVSQVLPIVAQLSLGSGESVVIEQPELHLHPKAQADLGDLLLESVGLGKQIIVETHSEHLLLRVLKRVRQGRLDPKEVSVLYVDTGSEGSEVQELRIDHSGEFLDDWPRGFFEERLEELLD